MRKLTSLILVSLGVFSFWTATPSAEAGWGNLFEGVKGLISGGGLENEDIVAGLKEALRIGTDNSVTQVGKIDGYLKNPAIHIGLPGPVAKAEKLLRFAGYGEQVDAFETSMNRAAEKAAPQAKEIFWQAIAGMTLDDARQILDGGDTAATDYFAERTRPQLMEIFSPIVHDSLASVGATKKFQDLDTTLRTLPLGESLSFDLDHYVTDGALDGLFLILGEEERKIRENPAARTTELLKKVFSAAK